MQLRPYQKAAVDAVVTAVDPWADRSFRRVLYTMPTGSGKTQVFSELTRRFIELDQRVLVLAHRTELIEQTYKRVRDYCGLREYDIGIEKAEYRINGHEKVVIGSNQSVCREGRLNGWRPTVIIQDETHRSAAETYRRVYDRFNDAILIGCTATAKRLDRTSLYATDVDGSPVTLTDKKGRKFEAKPEESIFEARVFDYSMIEAIEDGWLVPPHGHVVATETSLDDVKTVGGEFVEGQLAKAVDNAKRTMLAIDAWKQIAQGKPTLVFCAGVEHAHHSAELWREAGFTAAALDGTTESFTRHQIYEQFKKGQLDVLTNDSLFTEGADIPNCACIVFLRPTKSWARYVQCAGRGLRPLDGLLNGMEEAPAEERIAKIAASAKPKCEVIDLVDMYKKCGELCTLPSIIDLPVNLNLEGHSVSDAKKLLDEAEEAKQQIIGECPVDFTELKALVQDVNMLRTSGAQTSRKWAAYADGSGFAYNGLPPGFSCHLFKRDDDFTYSLQVRGPGHKLIYDKTGKAGRDMRDYLDHAKKHADRAISEYREAHPVNRGTSQRLTIKQLNCLRVNGHTVSEVDAMPYAKAKALISAYMERWKARVG